MNEKKQTNKRVILHADVNNFFASVECSLNKELSDKPVAVTGNPNKRTGIILAKNEIAKKYGIKTGQVIGEAKALCPQLVCLPPHYDLYEQISQELHSIYLEYTNFVEPLGLDECWLDVTGCENYLHKSGIEIANELRQRVKQELNITISVGVSFSKLFAKLGSDMRKPDFTTEIPFDKFKEKTYSLPLNSIVGIGNRLEKKFSQISIKTIGDFVQLEDSFLDNLMGINGINLKLDLLALRNVPVLDYYKLPPPKSIGNGTTTIKDIKTKKEIEKVIYFLAQKVSSRMVRHNVYGSTISIKLKSHTLKTIAKSSKINPTNSVKDISNYAISLCDKIYKYNVPLRAIRIKMSNLSSASIKQLSMFDTKEKDYSNVIVEINKKYGKIHLASDSAQFLNNSHHPQE